MITSYRLPALAAGLIAASVWGTSANAASTDVVLNLEGNPTCSSLGPNGIIQDIKVSGPGSSGVAEDVTTGQSITYDINNNNAMEWNVVTGVAVNYVILKGKGGNGGGTVYHYGVSGSAGDSVLVIFPDSPDDVDGSTINAVSFCYGLSDTLPPPPQPTPPPPVVDMMDCESLTGTTTLDGTKFEFDSCPEPVIDPVTGEPTGESERIIVSFNPSEKNFGLTLCTCNLGRDGGDGTFGKCNPDADVQPGQPPGPDACPNGLAGGNVQRVPIEILGVEDPASFLCFAAGGGRSCFFHDSK